MDPVSRQCVLWGGQGIRSGIRFPVTPMGGLFPSRGIMGLCFCPSCHGHLGGKSLPHQICVAGLCPSGGGRFRDSPVGRASPGNLLPAGPAAGNGRNGRRLRNGKIPHQTPSCPKSATRQSACRSASWRASPAQGIRRTPSTAPGIHPTQTDATPEKAPCHWPG